MSEFERHPESRLIQICTRPVAPEAIDRAKLNLLDWLGCLFAARSTPVAAAMGRAHQIPQNDIVRAGLCTGSLDAQTAALFLGTLGNVLEMDDLHRASILHPGDVVAPAALTVALRQECRGVDLLTSLTRGYEAAIRIGRAAAASGYTNFYNSGTCGIFGGAVAAADLLGGDAEILADAMGQAGMMASGLWQCRLEPTFSKQLATAQSARSAVLAATLAVAGFPGARAILTGPMGFLNSFYPNADIEQLTAAGDWALLEMSFKPFPSCRHTHPAISAALDLRGAGKLPQRVIVGTYRAALDFCDNEHPKTPDEARFSLQHAIAVALINGPPEIADFDAETINDPVIRTMRSRVKLEVAHDIDAAFPQNYGTRVRTEDATGKAQEITCPAAWGDPENPMQETDIVSKFLSNAAHGNLTRTQAERIAQTVGDLSTAPDLSALQSAFDAALSPKSEYA